MLFQGCRPLRTWDCAGGEYDAVEPQPHRTTAARPPVRWCSGGLCCGCGSRPLVRVPPTSTTWGSHTPGQTVSGRRPILGCVLSPGLTDNLRITQKRNDNVWQGQKRRYYPLSFMPTLFHIPAQKLYKIGTSGTQFGHSFVVWWI